MRIIAVIPARLKSKRLPRKLLEKINGYPLLWHVWRRSCCVKLINQVIIATDSKEILEVMQGYDAEVMLTGKHCRSGTERIASIIDQLDADFVINIQGDEPLISPSLIDNLALNWIDDPCDIITAARIIEDPELLKNPNVVKVVRSIDGRALYFSRSPVPYLRDIDQNDWLKNGIFWQHIGIYGYSRQVLEAYPTLPESPLETMEKLEQLRFLEVGYSIRVLATNYQPHSVDTLEDLVKVRGLIRLEEK